MMVASVTSKSHARVKGQSHIISTPVLFDHLRSTLPFVGLSRLCCYKTLRFWSPDRCQDAIRRKFASCGEIVSIAGELSSCTVHFVSAFLWFTHACKKTYQHWNSVSNWYRLVYTTLKYFIPTILFGIAGLAKGDSQKAGLCHLQDAWSSGKGVRLQGRPEMCGLLDMAGPGHEWRCLQRRGSKNG